jgi:methylmalonyl-CoA mutase N-terminal domain/subunit
VVRVTVQALGAVLGGTQSLHTNSFDEALALPSEDSALLAVRTQQILAHESGVTNTADPLAGSYFVEALTDEIEARAQEYLTRIEELGGAARAVDFMKEEIHRAAYRFQLEVERGERTVVGVNAFRDESGSARIQKPDYPALEASQVASLGVLKKGRDPTRVRSTLENVRSAARTGENLLPPMIDAVKATVSLGEISDVLREEWGTYDEG